MNKITSLTKLACFALVGAALLTVPAASRAQNATTTTNAPASSKKHGSVFHGKVAAVDANAMTFTVGETTAVVGSSTKIFKDGQPATFSDITVGENVVCNYKKDEAGKYNATTVRIGAAKKKAGASKEATTATDGK